MFQNSPGFGFPVNSQSEHATNLLGESLVATEPFSTSRCLNDILDYLVIFFLEGGNLGSSYLSYSRRIIASWPVAE